MKDLLFTHGADIGAGEGEKSHGAPFATHKFHFKSLAIRINMDNCAHVP